MKTSGIAAQLDIFAAYHYRKSLASPENLTRKSNIQHMSLHNMELEGPKSLEQQGN